MPVFEKLNELLSHEKWLLAKKEIKNLLEGDLSDEDAKFLLYNLITCSFKLGEYSSALRLAKRNREILGNDYDAIYKEIMEKTSKPTQAKPSDSSIDIKTKDGMIVKIALFNSDTKFIDVIGLKKVKKYMVKHIIKPILNPDIYMKHGAPLSNGAILYGASGVGKTLLARAAAHESNGKMLVIRLPDIINKYAGDSEKNVKKIFDEAKKLKPAIIFIDEIDGIATNRGDSDGDVGQGSLMHNVVNTLLTELDGITKDMQGVFVLGSTNKPWMIDNAIKRSGRFSDLIYIPPPTLFDRKKMFLYYLKKTLLGKVDLNKIALSSFGMSPADIKDIVDKAANETAYLEVTTGKSRGINTYDIIKQIKEKKASSMVEWYKEALSALQNMTPMEQNSYKDLKKDVRFWIEKAEGMSRMQKLLSNFI